MSKNDIEVQDGTNQNKNYVNKTINDPNVNEKEFSNILKVKADDKNISPDERARKVKLLAGAIAHGLRQFGNVYVRCFSPACCFKASKAIAIARSHVASQGFDLYNICAFIEADMGGKTKTGICYECFTNATGIESTSNETTTSE